MIDKRTHDRIMEYVQARGSKSYIEVENSLVYLNGQHPSSYVIRISSSEEYWIGDDDFKTEIRQAAKETDKRIGSERRRQEQTNY